MTNLFKVNSDSECIWLWDLCKEVRGENSLSRTSLISEEWVLRDLGTLKAKNIQFNSWNIPKSVKQLSIGFVIYYD